MYGSRGYTLSMRSIVAQGLTWYEDENPREEELRVLQRKYHFHDLDIEDCLSEHERPKIEEYESYLFLVFHIPFMNQFGRVLKEEVNIFVGSDFIVTLHEGKIPVLDDLWRELQRDPLKQEETLQRGTGFFLYEIMERLFSEGFPILDAITKHLRKIEATLFEHEESTNLLRDILALKRNIITMRSTLLPQRALIAALEHKNEKFIPTSLEIYFDNILDAIERQWALLDRAKELSEALQDTHEAWLTHRTNAVIRILTIFSVTVLPLNLLESLYGMNVMLPLQQHPAAFLLIVGAMIFSLVVFLGYFWWKKWIGY